MSVEIIDHPAWKRLLSWLGLRRQTLTIPAGVRVFQDEFVVTGYKLKWRGDENLTTHIIKGNRFGYAHTTPTTGAE